MDEYNKAIAKALDDADTEFQKQLKRNRLVNENNIAADVQVHGCDALEHKYFSKQDTPRADGLYSCLSEP